jgi:Tol biopolymer transport system component
VARIALRLFAAGFVALTGCGQRTADEHSAQMARYDAFGSPERVAIRGYDGDAMEPFVTPDGRYLLFNNRNDPRIDTNLHFARRIDSLTFQYGGELKGANTPALEGVPSLDRAGNLFFISTRSYKETLSSLYRGRFIDGTVSDVGLVSGVSRRQPGIVMFDAEIGADGNTLFVVDGEFSGGPHPRSADIAIAVRDGAGFRRLTASGELLKNVNTSALEYAPAVSSDLLELFFTRATGTGAPAIFRSARRSTAEPFETPQRVSAISGFVEAPALSGDGRSLYYHKLEDRGFLIYRVSRP